MSNAIDTWFAKNEKDFETDCNHLLEQVAGGNLELDEEGE